MLVRLFTLVLSLAMCSPLLCQQETELTPAPQTSPGRDVEVTVYLIDIEEINSRSQSFIANVFIGLQWQDPDLAHAGPGWRGVSLDDIWSPNVQIVNQQKLVKTFSDTAQVAPNGTVNVRQRYWGGFSQPLELRTFPFDSQRLQLILVNAGAQGANPIFSISSASGVANRLKLPDWKVQNWDVKTTVTLMGRNQRNIPAIEMNVDVKRSTSFFTLKVIFPLMLIVAMSWLVFWIDPKLVASQISVSVTAMLTLIAYRFAIGGMVPRLAFLTSLDYFVLGSSVMVFLTLVEVAFTAYLVEQGEVEKARSVDRKARWLVPALFLAMTLETLWLRWGLI
jgi:hypothetical protein